MNKVARTALLATSLIIALAASAMPSASAQLTPRADQIASSSSWTPPSKLGAGASSLDPADISDMYVLGDYTLMQVSLNIGIDPGLGFALLRDTRRQDNICKPFGGDQSVFGGAVQITGPSSFMVDGVVNCTVGPYSYYVHDEVRHYRYNADLHAIRSDAGDWFTEA